MLDIPMRLDVTVLGPEAGNLEFLCCTLEAEFLLLRGTSVFDLKDFKGLDKAHGG